MKALLKRAFFFYDMKSKHINKSTIYNKENHTAMSFYYKNKIRSHHYVYLTVCTHDESKHIFYIGKRSSYVPPEQDKLYLGSGSIIKRSIKKYGRESFRKIILETCNTEQEAYDLEQLLADEVMHYLSIPDGKWRRGMTKRKKKASI